MMMPTSPPRFTFFAQLLHWVMAAMVLSMLFIGAAMVVSPACYHALGSIHRPLGIAILVLVAVRFGHRLLVPPPPLPATTSALERTTATGAEWLMYALMFALPVAGWGMLSAARYPVVLYGQLHLPYILPHNLVLYACLRRAHTVLAYLLYLTVLAHLGAVLFHALIVRDGVLSRMLPWVVRGEAPEPPGPAALGHVPGQSRQSCS